MNNTPLQEWESNLWKDLSSFLKTIEENDTDIEIEDEDKAALFQVMCGHVERGKREGLKRAVEIAYSTSIEGCIQNAAVMQDRIAKAIEAEIWMRAKGG